MKTEDVVTKLAPIDDASAWLACERDKASFTVKLQPRHLDAFESALRAVQRKTDDPEAITRDDFRLAEIADDIAAWREEVMRQSGLLILKCRD